jgi:hypothetical protein
MVESDIQHLWFISSNEYKSEFDIVEIPWFVKWFIFPIIVTLGKLAGRHRKFDGAPEAINK